jgi:hypothetical protein
MNPSSKHANGYSHNTQEASSSLAQNLQKNKQVKKNSIVLSKFSIDFFTHAKKITLTIHLCAGSQNFSGKGKTKLVLKF